MNFLPEEFDEILNIFREESEEIVQKFNSNLLHFEKNPDDLQIISVLFQEAHSLKGAARMIGFFNIQNIAHLLEDLLTLIKDNKLTVTQEVFNKLYKTSDFLLFLIKNSVSTKQDYECDSIKDLTEELNILIGGEKQSTFTKNHDESEDYSNFDLEKFLRQTTSITALVMESVFILNRYDETEKDTLISILSDNFNNLFEIFCATKFSEITEKIENLKTIFKHKTSGSEHLDRREIDLYKQYLNEIIQGINIIFSHLSIPSIDNELIVAGKNEPEAIEEVAEEEKSNKNELKEKLDYLSGNISQIKTDPTYVENSQKCVLSILNYGLCEDISKIYKKVFDILEQIKKLGIKPESDIVTILTQSINITKKIILNNESNEEEDLSLLFQRLSIVEQMIDISEINYSDQLVEASPKRAIEPEFQKVQDFFKNFEIGTIKTLRVDTKKLDSLLAQTGELIINGIKTQKHLKELDKINTKLTEWSSLFKKSINYIKYYEKKSIAKFETNDVTNAFTRQIMNLFEDNLTGINELLHDVNELYKQIHEDDIKLNHIILEIENIAKSVRVLPLATVFHMFPRMVRDIATTNNKEVELYISGSDTSVDKKIIEEIKMPLIHILRNSIDHGIELPSDRMNNGKPRAGKINLSARQDENKIIIEIEDDGTGINIKKVKEKALQKGLLTSDEINSMNDEQIMNLIFWPGFSTGETITEISGRGIGLDIVQTKISQLNGKVKVYSELNKGAKVIIELPVSMATIKSFIITIEEQTFAIPMSAIKLVQWIDEDKIFYKDGYKSIIVGNETIPIIDLAKILGIKRKTTETKKNTTVVIIESENTKAAYIVDKLLGDQEILHKKFAPPVFKLKNIGGITTLASGDLCLIINVSELLKNTIANIEKLSCVEQKLISTNNNDFNPSEYKILLVEDSKITLTLLEKLLKKQGYEIISTQNPIDAIEKLKYEPFDLIITDIEMPNLNGVDFIHHIKNNEMYNNIPIMVISTIPPKNISDKLSELNISSYINKLSFEKNDFINKIESALKQKDIK